MPEHFFHEGFGVGQAGLVQEAQRSLSLPRRRGRTDLNRQQSSERILFNKNQNVFSTSSLSSLKSLSCDSGKAARYSTIHSREVAAVSVPKIQIWNNNLFLKKTIYLGSQQTCYEHVLQLRPEVCPPALPGEAGFPLILVLLFLANFVQETLHESPVWVGRGASDLPIFLKSFLP